MVEIKKKILNKHGITTINTIILMAVIFPIFLFLTVDFPHMIAMNRRVKSVLDNSASTAITEINDNKTPLGILEIDKDKAVETVNKIVATSLKLNSDLTPNRESLIIDTPTISTTVINNPSKNPTFVSKNGSFPIKNPSVAVYAEVPVRCLVFGNRTITLKYTSIAQVQFKSN